MEPEQRRDAESLFNFSVPHEPGSLKRAQRDLSDPFEWRKEHTGANGESVNQLTSDFTFECTKFLLVLNSPIVEESARFGTGDFYLLTVG